MTVMIGVAGCGSVSSPLSVRLQGCCGRAARAAPGFLRKSASGRVHDPLVQSHQELMPYHSGPGAKAAHDVRELVGAPVQLMPDIVLRRPSVADGPAIEAMFARCSLESRYSRFLAPLVTIPADHLARILTPPSGDEAWVAVSRNDPGMVVALGSWARVGADAEFALIVDDSWQRHGIGRALLRVLAERAWNAGVCRFTASVLRESRHVLRMLGAVLGPMSTRADGYVSHVTIDLCDET